MLTKITTFYCSVLTHRNFFFNDNDDDFLLVKKLKVE